MAGARVVREGSLDEIPPFARLHRVDGDPWVGDSSAVEQHGGSTGQKFRQDVRGLSVLKVSQRLWGAARI